MALTIYNKKRNFKQTAEPEGKVSKDARMRFVIQRHHASHIHYDFRLELGGALKSWAVPKGPSLNPAVKRLAMLVEDHPVSYIDFEGTIPKGNYGAGTVEVWDTGNFIPVDEKGNPITAQQALAAFKKGSVKIDMKGRKLKGGFALVQLKKDSTGKSWLLIKHRDVHATDEDYNAEDFSKNKKKEDSKSIPALQKTITQQSAKKKPSKIEQQHFGNNEKKLSHFTKPMLASPGKEAFNNSRWLYELKLDGYRAIAETGKKPVRLYSRNGLSFTSKYVAITQALQQLEHDAILDGEIVLLNEQGHADFQRLQFYENHSAFQLVYYVFDLLMLNGTDTTGFALTERKALLKAMLPEDETIRYCDHLEGDAIGFFKKVTEQNIEGIMAKRMDSIYCPGTRSKDWLKIKNIQTHEAVIAGYTKGKGSRKHFGALILGKYNEHQQLQYIGHTGTGFNEVLLAAIWNQMQPLVTVSSPFNISIKVNAPVTWVKPTLVAELNYTEMTRENIMRHPVFVRLRPDQNANEIIMKTTAAVPAKQTGKKGPALKSADEKIRSVKVGSHKVELTNLDKIYWPLEGYTKGDLLKYYNQMADYILPYLKNRPLSLKRNPNGINDPGFYHKDAADTAPSWVKSADLYAESANKTIHYIVCNNKATLLYLANLGCIEMNPWNSTTGRLTHPTYMVIDIDPADKNSFEQVIETALVTKAVLDQAGASSWCKTSGATGLHVYIPLGNRYDYEVCKAFAQVVATLVQEQLPNFTSLERNLKKRGNNIYVDFLQNRSGQTLASAYSLRPKAGATVSTPLEWKEVKPGLHPTQFDLNNIFKRLQKKGDLFAPVLGKGINVIQCLKKLGA